MIISQLLKENLTERPCMDWKVWTTYYLSFELQKKKSGFEAKFERVNCNFFLWSNDGGFGLNQD